jgi:hypothetical protein
MRTYTIFISFILLFISSSPAQDAVENEMFSIITAMEGKSHQIRADVIKNELRSAGIGYITVPFRKILRTGGDTLVLEGENIIARIGNGSSRIVVGAHYDAFKGSPGANNNASGVSVALAIIKALRDSSWKYTVDFCFFDQKENGMAGSAHFVQQFVIPKLHLAMINLDVEGLGDEIYAGPVGNNNRQIMRYVNEAAQQTGSTLSAQPYFPASDFTPFAEKNLENISVSVVPLGDGERISKYVQNGYKPDSAGIPQALGLLRTPFDSSGYVSAYSLKMAYSFTKALLLLLNNANIEGVKEIVPDKNMVKKRK